MLTPMPTFPVVSLMHRAPTGYRCGTSLGARFPSFLLKWAATQQNSRQTVGIRHMSPAFFQSSYATICFQVLSYRSSQYGQ